MLNSSYLSGKWGGDKYDLLKFVLAIMVVMLHTNVLPSAMRPVLTTAVPLFFLMSSYFFFLKVESLEDFDKPLALKKYVLRNAKLFAFWSILVSAVIILLQSKPGLRWLKFAY